VKEFLERKWAKMILITGGLGFIGLHTASALLDMGEKCVLTQHRVNAIPDTFKAEIGSRLFIEQLDVTDASTLLKLGDKYPITGIIHLAVHWKPSQDPSVVELFENTQANLLGLANTLQAAQRWQVKRVLIASTHNVYGDDPGMVWREEQPINLTAAGPVLAIKKSMEIVADFLAGQTGIECIILRFGEIFGPLNHWNSIPGILVQAAVKGENPGLTNVLSGVYAQDGCDRCYVKDAARAVALLQLASTLHHRVYNIATGRPTKNQDIVAAIKEVIPEAQLELPSDDVGAELEPSYQDITWLVEDTGYQPQFTTGQAIADYIAWLRAGNDI
jgi:UDP-glucose 4-epimerase